MLVCDHQRGLLTSVNAANLRKKGAESKEFNKKPRYSREQRGQVKTSVQCYTQM